MSMADNGEPRDEQDEEFIVDPEIAIEAEADLVDLSEASVSTGREAELEAEVATLRDQALRAVAELDNTRKRFEREREQTRKFGIQNFAKDLLNAADNMRRALDAAPADLDVVDEAVKTFIVGVEMTERELLNAFEKNGIQRIDPIGEKFDYNLHEAAFEVEDPASEPGTIVQVLQAGYMIEDRLLRAAMVGVSKGGGGSGESVDTTA